MPECQKKLNKYLKAISVSDGMNIKTNFVSGTFNGQWALLGSPRLSWAPLGSPGLSWAPLGSLGLPCALLGSPGLSWRIRKVGEHSTGRIALRAVTPYLGRR